MKTIVLALMFLLPSSESQALSFKILNPKVSQGDVLIIRIEPQWQGPQVSIAIFGKHYLPNKYGEVFIGIDKKIAPGKYIATLVEYGRGVRLSLDHEEVEVVQRDFLIRKAVPGKPRNFGEIGAIRRAYERGNQSEKYIAGKFIMPLDRVVLSRNRAVGDVFSSFGGENHRGVDLITLDPESKKYKRPVKAINSGRIILVAKSFSLEGNMVIIDHGSGIFSLYMHLSRFNFKQGQLVKTGQVIGVSGKSGRVTGPHLHLAVRVGDPTDPLKFTVVDPIRFIEIMNQHLK